MVKENVLIIYFNIESEGYQAFTEMRQHTFSQSNSIIIEQASLIKRENGTIIAKDFYNNEKNMGEDVAIGSIIGGLIGILGGPLGVLLGMGVGAAIGSLPSLDDTEENSGLLQSVVSRLQEDDIAILAVVQEENEAQLDNYFAKFDTTIIRYDANVIEEEVEYADEVQKELARQARVQMKQKRSEERKRKVEEKGAEIHARFEVLKEKLKS
ncbi:DUF1269 domain-containing protein [Paenibacillus dakarensis]|uniref:DUF1269 domain-containing protein n=1 Tax=Paenibacillus dakarensis TaxID=1527293 RepID=UPI0006D53B7C|nr:DUF1269 domain-containing protein [Paenibacillus dakarensis]